MSKYVESIVRTNRLWCSACGKKINKGDDVVFYLSSVGKMNDVYGECCKSDYMVDAYNDTIHPFDSEALGQE